MTHFQSSSDFSPGNLVWAAMGLFVSLLVAFVGTAGVRPKLDVEDKRGNLRSESRLKISAEETKVLESQAFALSWKESLSALKGAKPRESGVKFEPNASAQSDSSPALPSSPSGAVNIGFPRLIVPSSQTQSSGASPLVPVPAQ